MALDLKQFYTNLEKIRSLGRPRLKLAAHSKVPLAMIGPGQKVRLIRVTTERKLRHRLAELGLTPGVELEVLQEHSGTLLVAVRDARLALGREMTRQVIVQAV